MVFSNWSKNRGVKKYCSCDTVCRFSALWSILCRSYFEKPSNDEKYQQSRSIFYPSNDVCLQYYLLRRKKYVSCVVAMRARFTTWVLQHQHLRQVKMYFYLLSFHLFLYWNMYLRVVLLWCFKEIIIFLDAVRNKFQTVNIY